MTLKLTPKRLQILEIVEDLSKKVKNKMAYIEDIIRYVQYDRDVKHVNIRRLTIACKEMGFLENPVWGGYRLTEKGEKVLEKVKYRADSERA